MGGEGNMKKLYVAFVWHHHQPYYRDPERDLFIVPWTRLHATKDYYTLARDIDRYANLRMTINFVPSLLLQMREYTEENVEDEWLEVLKRKSNGWSWGDRRFMIKNFFRVNKERIFPLLPRYAELWNYIVDRGEDTALRQWTLQEFRDLAVLFHLAWIDPDTWQEEDDLKALVEKGRDFSDDDIDTLIEIIFRIMGKVVPIHKKLWDDGKIEIIYSPFFHPILPLLIDNYKARTTLPFSRLPLFRFAYPEDARWHVQRAQALTTEIWGKKPEGMWPSEQAVSTRSLSILAEEGVRWVVTDEEILARTMHMPPFRRDSAGVVDHPKMLYRPYKLISGGRSLYVFFRDRVLSDLIGFEYPRWEDSEAAAKDFMEKLYNIYSRLEKEDGDFIITVALDGENCWEHYPENGRIFRRALFDMLSRENWIETITPGMFMKESDMRPEDLDRIYSGSWIFATFHTWIGDPMKNMAWDYLSWVRRDFEWMLKRGWGDTDKAHFYLMAAEGSDWFWWYGEPHHAEEERDYDSLFRSYLKSVYRYMLAEPPEFLDISIYDRV